MGTFAAVMKVFVLMLAFFIPVDDAGDDDNNRNDEFELQK